MSISEFSLFDEPPKKENQMNEIKLQTKQKLNFDNISDVFSFSKKNDIPTKSTTPNDNTDINSPILFNSLYVFQEKKKKIIKLMKMII